MVGMNNANLVARQSCASSLMRLKCAHLKKKADEALKDGKHRLAWETYSEAIEISPDTQGPSVASLYSNRSLAFYKAHRYEDALKDADKAVQIAPSWSKGYWRRGTALVNLNKIPLAVGAFFKAWNFERDVSGKKECCTKLHHVIQKLTREDLGECIMKLFEDLQTNGSMNTPQIESVDAAVLRESAFRMITEAHKGQPKPGIYYERYFSWLHRDPMTVVEAYVLRSEIYCRARCYLQAAADAQDAISLILERYNLGQDNNEMQYTREQELSAAYARLAIAHLAEKNHADQCAKSAYKALSKALELDSENQELRDRLQQTAELLTKEHLEQAQWEAYNEGAMPNGSKSDAIKRMFRADIVLSFPSGSIRALSSAVREALRQAIADAASISIASVTLERVLPPCLPDRPVLQLTFHVAMQQPGNAVDRSIAIAPLMECDKGESALVQSIRKNGIIHSALGDVDPTLCSAEMIDITPAHITGQMHGCAAVIGGTYHDNDEEQQQKALILPSSPKLELEIPYKKYRLVTAEGVAVERTDKHPFCMSRVYYDASDKPEEIWAELADGSCRWRQTGSEIRIIALHVPLELPPRDLHVVIEPFHVYVANKMTKEVYLQGILHRGVVPEDSYWTLCGGTGEDGCCITLQKMNLEVLQRHWMHSEMWWSKLFEDHSDIAWDDYEKDYSDLPEEVLSKHRIAEAVKEEQRQIEHGEREKRESLQRADDGRKKRRQERLSSLRNSRK